ncbi:MAG TPA: hypothetical protein VEQ41_08135 [Solirubrobacterales bacterium]|nr:hypothetical protein [Solirubrobacterales bacterium]
MKEVATNKTFRDWVLGNPLFVAGAVGLLVYAELRIPAELFYRSFGVSADAAGYGTIDVVLQQSVQLLTLYLLVGALWAVGFSVVLYPTVVTAQTLALRGDSSSWLVGVAYAVPLGGLLLAVGAAAVGWWPLTAVGIAIIALALLLPAAVFKKAWRERREAARQARGLAHAVVLGGLAFSASVLLIVSLAEAGPSANGVKNGFSSSFPLYPWHADHVSVAWRSESPDLDLSDCTEVMYLGEDGRRVLLYDVRRERTLRLNSNMVELSFPDDCY